MKNSERPIIELTDTTRITADAYQWILQRRTWNEKTNDWSNWKTDGYYGSLKSLITHTGDKLLRESEAQTLTQLLQDVENIGTALSRALTPIINIELPEAKRND